MMLTNSELQRLTYGLLFHPDKSLTASMKHELATKLIEVNKDAGVLEILVEHDREGLQHLLREIFNPGSDLRTEIGKILDEKVCQADSKINLATPPTPGLDETSVSNLDGRPLPPQALTAGEIFSAIGFLGSPLKFSSDKAYWEAVEKHAAGKT